VGLVDEDFVGGDGVELHEVVELDHGRFLLGVGVNS
jgi:hypothetical protein